MEFGERHIEKASGGCHASTAGLPAQAFFAALQKNVCASDHTLQHCNMTILYVVLSLSGANIKADYTLGNQHKSIVLSGKKSEVISQCNLIYDTIEAKTSGKAKQLRAAVVDLSTKLVTPVADLVKATDHINFIVDKALVRCAFDLLENAGQPLYLTHKITYTNAGYRAKNNPHQPKGGLFVADPTTDPEDGLKQASQKIAGSKWLAVKDASLKRIRSAKKYNTLVISAHGDLDNTNSGSMGINDEELDSDLFETVSADFAYFDSCQMGVNWDFVETFQSERTARYMLAPITSNDAGDSSTRTVMWFFESLQQTGDAAAALLKTRQRLFKQYTKEKLNYVTILNKAFPFRLYEFPR